MFNENGFVCYISNFGLRVKYAPGKGFNQLNFIPL